MKNSNINQNLLFAPLMIINYWLTSRVQIEIWFSVAVKGRLLFKDQSPKASANIIHLPLSSILIFFQELGIM